MKLYYLPGACSLAPHIVLRETGTAVTLAKVDRNTKQTDTGENFLEVNPKGYVPAIALDDGTVITEAQVVLQYLADQTPDSGVAPAAGTLDHYKLQEWLGFISTELHKNMGSFFNPKQTPEWRETVAGLLGKRLDYVTTQLEGKDFILGNAFTVADAYLFTVLNWSGKAKFDLGPWPVLVAYHKRLSERPSVQQAMKEEGLL
jgi:glutathione S-transferase